MNTAYPQRIALTTCDNVFEAGGVGNSVARIARGLSTHFNVEVDIIMLDPNASAGFNPRGQNGIEQLDQRLGAVSVFKLEPWTGGTSTAQSWVDIHYALLELAQERQYEILHAFY